MRRPVFARSRPFADRLAAAFACACTVALLALALSIRLLPDGARLEPDALIDLRQIAERPGGGWRALHDAMLAATACGAFPTLALVVAAVSCFLWGNGGRAVACRLALAAGTGTAAANLAKHLFGRLRPDVVAHWTDVSSASFPSGHSADGAAVYLLLAAIGADAITDPTRRRCLSCAAAALVVLIGCSRLYLGVHWPSDVLAGWMFGAAWAYASAPFVRGSQPIAAHDAALQDRY